MSLVRTLHHFPLDPASRQVRLALAEKRLPFEDVVVRYWEQPEEFTALNPSGLTPVLVEAELRPAQGGGLRGRARSSSTSNRRRPQPDLLGRDPAERAEARRLMQWFDRKFDNEVNAICCTRSWRSGCLKLGAPDLYNMRQGRDALRVHLVYSKSCCRRATGWPASG
jgi:glutathione S-transferase